MEVFFSDRFCDELVSWDHEHTTCTITVIVLAKDTYGEYSDVDNLSLYISYPDSITDMILPEYEKECQNREYKILQCDDECTDSHREEAKTATILECHDNEKNRNN